MRKGSRRTMAVKCILTVLLIVFILSTWPGYLFHEEYVSRTLCDRYESSDILDPGSVATQYFVPRGRHLSGIEFLVLFNESCVGNGSVEFLLCEESGHEIFSREIMLEQMESDEFYRVDFPVRLKEGTTYYWMLVGPDDEDAGLQMMYTGHLADQAPENTLFLLNDEQHGETAQTVSQYIYFTHADKAVIIGKYWVWAALVYIICMDIVTRLFREKRDAAA